MDRLPPVTPEAGNGEITLNGEVKRVVLVDYNSNARFDDAMSIATISDGAVYPSAGDMIFVLEGEKASQEIESFDSGLLHIPSDAPEP